MVSGCFSAAQNALKMPNRSAEGTKFLLTLLDTLERVGLLGYRADPAFR